MAPARVRPRRSHGLFPFARRTPVLVVPGLHDSGPDHWQTRWQARHREFRRVVQSDFANPDLPRWAATLDDAVRSAGRPPIVVAHSFGCLAAIEAASSGTRFAAALLVAPADPDRFGRGDLARRGELDCPAILVASTDDPWLKLVKAGVLAARWGATLAVEPNAGHINAVSGLGDWPRGFALLRDLAERAAARPRRLN